MPNTPVMAFSTDRLKAVGETGSPVLMVRRMSVVRRNSPWREANTTLTSSCATQSCATFRATLDSVLRRRRTIGSIKPMSGAADAAAGQLDQRATGMVQCRSGISVFARRSEERLRAPDGIRSRHSVCAARNDNLQPGVNPIFLYRAQRLNGTWPRLFRCLCQLV